MITGVAGDSASDARRIIGPAGARQADIGDDQRKFPFSENSQGLIAIVHGQDRVAFGLQGIGQGNTQDLLVFDDQNAFAHVPSGIVKTTFVPMFSRLSMAILP